MLVLGIDPGTHRTGYGVVARQGSRLVRVDSGTLAAGDGELATRLVAIADGLDQVIARHRPLAVSVESIFHAKNARSALVLGHARGVALLCASRAGLPVFEYTPGQIKQATTGRGRADKPQVQAMLKLLLGYDCEGLDESDALAAALCHLQLHSTPLASKLRAAARGGA